MPKLLTNEELSKYIDVDGSVCIDRTVINSDSGVLTIRLPVGSLNMSVHICIRVGSSNTATTTLSFNNITFSWFDVSFPTDPSVDPKSTWDYIFAEVQARLNDLASSLAAMIK